MRIRVHSIAGAGLLGLLLLVQGASGATGAAGWTTVSSPHFHVFSRVGPAAAERAAADLEHLRAFLVEIAPGGRFDGDVPFRVYLFEDTADLAHHHPGGTWKAGSPGVLLPTEHAIYASAVWATDQGTASRYLYKQYVLWVLSRNLPELPEWLRQGAAEYYGTFAVEEDAVALGLPVREHVHFLRMGPDGQGGTGLTTVDGRAVSPSPGSFHARSWALVHYLLLGRPKESGRMTRYIGRLVSGDDPDQAFREVFGEPLTAIDARLDAYVAGESFNYLKIPMDELPSFAASARPLSAAEEEVLLGDLLAHVAPSYRPRAEARFRRALELDPENGPAHAGLGWLAAESGDGERALSHLARAVELMPDDAQAHYLHGDALLTSLGRRRPEDEADLALLRRAQDRLRRALEIDPDLPAAWERLGFALNLEPKPTREAVDALQRAWELSPARGDLAVNLLLAYARLGDVDGADRVMGELRTRDADPEVLAKAREVRLRLRLHEANLLARDDRLDDAVAVIARVLAQTTDPSLAELAAAQLQRTSRAAEHNRYVERYREAARLVEAGDPGAGEAVEALRQLARPGLQTAAAAQLEERWHALGAGASPAP